MVSGMMPKTLKLTQKSVVCVRQTISLSAASAKKNSAQRKVSLRQPSSVELEHAVEHDLEQGLAEIEAAEQHEPEHRVHDGGLELDEGLVLQEQGEAAEHHHHDARHHRHDRQLAGEPIADGKGKEGRHDEDARGGEDALAFRETEPVAIGVAEEEQGERARVPGRA